MQTFVKPNEGARVRQPERGSRVMPAAGDWISHNVFYEGLIASGDVIVVSPQPPYPKASDEPNRAPVAELAPPAPETGRAKSPK